MQRHHFALLLPAILCLAHACTPPGYYDDKKPGQTKVSIDLRNKQIQHLFDLRDQHQTDSLLRYLGHKNATLRYLATLSFASLRDSLAIDSVAARLNDPVEDVRIAAAFSLGQIGHSRAESRLAAAFRSDDSLSEHQRFNAVVLEAIGKCGSKASLHQLASISTYQPSDTLLLEGQCRGIYRFALRDSIDPTATVRMVNVVADQRIPEPARLIAANYLARARGVAPDSLQSVLMAAALLRSANPGIRMALARGLGKSQSQPAFAILSKVIHTEQDWRVKCNIISALAKFEYDTVRALVAPQVLDDNPHVARTAAEFFIANGQAKDGDYYWRLARDNPRIPWPAVVALYRASNKWLPGKLEPESKEFVNYRLKEIFQQSKNPYERAACLSALSEYGWQYRWIHDRGFNDASLVVKTTAAEALLSIAQRPDFYAYFGEAAKGVRRELYSYFREIANGGDAGMIAAAADGFRVETLNYKTLRDSARIADLGAALQKLKMPRDVEAYLALEKALAYFEDKPDPKPYKPAYNHPIDWNILSALPVAPKATVQTSRGTVVFELFPHLAPGSVANFVQLTASHFFDGKIFHRVAPNFVVQGGCPRGDGYGALDYTIRSEIGLNWYDAEGYVGMASAGPDTEGTQWFITHSPAPHLDGRYTIFARVVQGMDVVNQLQVGDVIEKISLQ